MGDDVKRELDAHGVAWHDEHDLRAAVAESDVVYQTRIQRERFATPEEARAAEGHYVITGETMASMKPGAILMHPLPRVAEIAPEVDADSRSAYFRQARNGVFVRMALLNELLGGD
jgi:aspartate carbamoyltransferase catalytic subunit